MRSAATDSEPTLIMPARMHIATSTYLLLFLLGCATTSTTVETLDDPTYRDKSFHNFLVVGIAADYDNQAQFERQMVSAIKAAGGSATAYYTLVGNNPPSTPEQLNSAISAGNFDAVLLTRVTGQHSEVDVQSGAPDTKVVRESGNFFDLFRYDYEEMNDPEEIEVETTVVVTTELYAAAATKKIWAVQTSTKTSEGVGPLIDGKVKEIMQHLQRERLIGK